MVASTHKGMAARRPIHVGTRLINAGSETVALLAAVPVFGGEIVERIALDYFAITKDDETNLDQPPIFSCYGVYVPYQFGSQDALSTGDLETVFREAYTSAGGTEYLGGEPNPGGNLDPLQGDVGFGMNRSWFRRNVIGRPIPTGRDALNNADARFFDEFRTVVNRDIMVETEGLLLFGSRLYRLDAQTDFGVADIDSTVTRQALQLSYTEPLEQTGVDELKIAELLYGGDNYIEADSFKETGRRSFCIVRPTIRKSPRIMRSAFR